MVRRPSVRPDRRPGPQLTWWHFCIVRACYRLTEAQKHVWELIRELDGKDGAWMSPAEMARQVGMPLKSFHDHRAALQRLSLLIRVEVRGSRIDFWFAVLPDKFPTEPPPGTEAKRAWVREWADALDRYLRDLSPEFRGLPAAEPGKAGLSSPEKPDPPPPLSPEFPKAQSGITGLTEHAGRESDVTSESLNAVSHRSDLLQLVSGRSRPQASETELQAPRGPLRGPAGTPENLTSPVGQPMGRFLEMVKAEIDKAELKARERREKPPDRAAPQVRGDAEATCARCGGPCERGPWPEQRCNRCAMAPGRQEGRAHPSDEEARVAMREGA